jgi:hypothetical protein
MFFCYIYFLVINLVRYFLYQNSNTKTMPHVPVALPPINVENLPSRRTLPGEHPTESLWFHKAQIADVLHARISTASLTNRSEREDPRSGIETVISPDPSCRFETFKRLEKD